MKILLLEHPRTISAERCNDIANTPLSSCLLTGYAAGMLKSEGHEVIILEGYLDNLTYAEITDTLENVKPDLLGVHLIYHWQREDVLFSFLNSVKEGGAVKRIIAYGYYPTIAFKDILAHCSSIDGVILGEPEITFSTLASLPISDNDIPDIAGLARRDSAGHVKSLAPEALCNLDCLPFPARSDAMYRLPEVNILGSRGCYGRCTFCYINSFAGPNVPWRGRNPENIVTEIASIIHEKGAKDFYFTDPNFFGPGARGQERALKIAELLKPLNIRFGIEGRVNDIHDETIAALVEAGLRHILVGLESGRNESLKRMNKMTTVAQNERALTILRGHGIEPNVGFIMFEPDSSLSDIRANLEFLKRNQLLNNLPVTANVLYHQQIILAGTQAFRQLQSEDRLELSASSNYEGTASFRNPRVSQLAELMREVTNFLFGLMNDFWSGRKPEPLNLQKGYRNLNNFLVDMFENSLTGLERGNKEVEISATSVIKEMELLFQRS